ncbi:MAG TPA: A24 family peptidase [Spirochaetota bacterium]|nr:A24 family peptidase [Spirochaetota bacterium]
MNIEMLIFLSAFITGSICGSFFYTLALRFVSGMLSEHPALALFSRSRCPDCGTVPGTLYMVPVLGWFFSRGRCRSCSGRISPFYPLWELLYGLLALLVLHVSGISINTLFIYLICCTSICIGIIDFMSMKIPGSLIAVLLILSVYPVVHRGMYLDSFYGFLLLSVFFLLVMLVFPGAFGGGDLKFYAAAGILLGLEQSVVLLEVSLVGGAVCGVAWALVKGGSLRQKIPFAPFISSALVITLLFGGRIALFYYSITY